jgi:Bacterial TSP3 repeat
MRAAMRGAHSEAMAHTTSPKSFSSVALAVSTLLSALSLSAFGAPSAHAETFAHEKQTCTSGVCLVAVKIMVDTDGDGVSDDDEIAAGTNPNDPFNRPSPKDLVGLAAEGKLPSFNDHVTEVLVMPTQGPDGQSLGNGYLPEREDLMKLFGIGGDMLKSSGLDPNGGVRITADRDAMFNIGGKNISSGHAPVRVGGLDYSLVSASGNERLFGMSPNAGKGSGGKDITTKGPEGTTTTRFYNDGSLDGQLRSSKDGSVSQTSLNASLDPVGTGSAAALSSGDIAYQVTDDKGTLSVTISPTTTANGSTSQTTTETRENKDGSGWTSTKTTTTSKGKNGKTTTTVKTKETSKACADCEPVVTQDDAPAEYSNPDADYTTIWISDAQYARIVGKFNDNKTPGPVKEGPLDGDSGVTVVAGAGFDPLVALVDDAEDADVTAFLAPFVKNVLVVNYDGGASPDKDPRLPDLLGSITAGAGGRCGGCNA